MHRSLEEFQDYIGVTRPLAALFSECTDGALIAILPSISDCSLEPASISGLSVPISHSPFAVPSPIAAAARRISEDVHQTLLMNLIAKNLFSDQMLNIDADKAIIRDVVICIVAPTYTMATMMHDSLSSQHPNAHMRFIIMAFNNGEDARILSKTERFQRYIKQKDVAYTLMMIPSVQSLNYYDMFWQLPRLCMISYKEKFVNSNINKKDAMACDDHEEGLWDGIVGEFHIGRSPSLNQPPKWQLNALGDVRVWLFHDSSVNSHPQRVFWVDVNLKTHRVIPTLNELERIVVSDTEESPRSLIQRMIESARPILL